MRWRTGNWAQSFNYTVCFTGYRHYIWERESLLSFPMCLSAYKYWNGPLIIILPCIGWGSVLSLWEDTGNEPELHWPFSTECCSWELDLYYHGTSHRKKTKGTSITCPWFVTGGTPLRILCPPTSSDSRNATTKLLWGHSSWPLPKLKSLGNFRVNAGDVLGVALLLHFHLTHANGHRGTAPAEDRVAIDS